LLSRRQSGHQFATLWADFVAEVGRALHQAGLIFFGSVAACGPDRR
jgi:hypothetical protein